ncbi:MAG: RNA 2',3'-cyclic phosphodiesterase [Candidatus Omnitrophota bacterium]
MRAFIAIELPKEIKSALAKIQEELKSSNDDVRWVEPKNIHLTLKFLGEIDEEKFNKLTKIIDDIVKTKNIFHMNLSSFGAFPDIKYPRVIWAGADKGDAELKVIVKELENKIQKIGIPKENRAFSSHITIGRVRSGLNKDKLKQKLEELSKTTPARKTVEFEVKKITLFKSTLTSKGPIYETIHQANFLNT